MDVSKMTGEATFRRGATYDEVSMNGDEGRFLFRDKNAVKDEKTGKYPKQPLKAGVMATFDSATGAKTITGVEPLMVVFLKIRRVLNVFKPEASMRTNEHNHKGDFVVLYGSNPQDKGTADEVRTRHPELRTQQAVYSYFPEKDQVVRLIVKGSSLGSLKEDKNAVKFYDYLQSFKGDDHFYQFITEITPVEEQGPKGPYYAMTFKRGARLDDAKLAKMVEYITEVHADIEEQDAAFKERMALKGDAPGEAGAQEDERAPEFTASADADELKYPDEDINPEDIPF